MNADVINQVIILFLIMMIGVFARKKNWITKETKESLSNILMNITLPFLLVSSFNYNYSEDMANKAKMIFIYSIIIHLCLIFISKVVTYKFDKESKKVLRCVTIFSNSGFMGYPILQALFGKIGIFYGAIYNIPFNLFILSVGVMIYTGKKDLKSLKDVLVNPGIIGTVIGIVLFINSIKMPYPIYETLNTVGSMTTPLSMIIVGAMLAEIELKEVFSGFTVYYASFLRLIAAPIITFLIFKLINADKLLLQICVIVQAMPASVLASVFAEKYEADSALAAKSVFITTIICLVTIPLVVMFL